MFSFKLFIFSMMLAVLVAEETSKKPTAKILSDKSFVRLDGYNFEFKTSDGVSRQEDAQLIKVGDHQGIGVKGSYSYIGPDGQEYMVTFTADDKGYKPVIHIVPNGGQQ